MRGLALCALSCSAGLVAGEIVSPGLGKCLDAQLKQKVDAGIKRRETAEELVADGRGAVNVQLYTCHEGFNQDFKITSTGQIELAGLVGKHPVPGGADTNLCLEAEDLTQVLKNNVRLTWCLATPASPAEVDAKDLTDKKKYTIVTKGTCEWDKKGAAAGFGVGTAFTVNEGKAALKADCGGKAVETALYEAWRDESVAFSKQTWILTGYGQLVIGTKCLDVKAEKTADGGREVWSEIKLHEKVNVQLYTCHNPEKTERVNQLWAWQPENFFSTDNWYTN